MCVGGGGISGGALQNTARIVTKKGVWVLNLVLNIGQISLTYNMDDP